MTLSPAQLEARSKGGKAVAKKPAPKDCKHCQHLGYTSWMQHLGHLGFSAVMKDNPTALHSLRSKIRTTGRPDSKDRWLKLSS